VILDEPSEASSTWRTETADEVAAMSCHEIRPLIRPVAHGRTRLTEWALVEAHLKHCAGCRADRERVDHEMAQSRPISAWSRARSRVSGTLAHSLRTAAGVTALPARLGHQLRLSMTGVVDAVGRTAGTARGWAPAAATGTRAASRWLVARGTAIRALAARATVTSTAAVVSFSRISAVQVTSIALVVGVALSLLLPTPILRPNGASDVSILRRPPVRPVPHAGSRRGPEAAAPRLASARSAAMVATTSAQSPRSGGPHVVGRLTVRERGTSEEALTALLHRSGGARIGGHHDVSAGTVYAVIPSSGYRKFIRGLGQIGSWQLDAERSPLPRGVRVAIRVGD